MTETCEEMTARHEREVRIAKEQYDIRMRTMQERHYSELMQVAEPGKETKVTGKP